MEVRAYTEQGVQIGLAFLAASPSAPLTFPGWWLCGEALDEDTWWRFATAAERSDGTRKAALKLRSLGWKPGVIVHSNGQVAARSDRLDLHGERVTVLPRVPTDADKKRKRSER